MDRRDAEPRHTRARGKRAFDEAQRADGKRKRTRRPAKDRATIGPGRRISSTKAVVTARSRTRGLPTPESSGLTESQASITSTDTQCAGVEEKSEDKGMQDAKNVFPFLELPAELRVHIYRMAFFRNEPLLLHLRHSEEEPEDDHQDALTKGSRPTESSSGDQSNHDRLSAGLLCTCSLVYKEARQVLYAENTFILSLTSGITTLSALHQRSRSLIKAVTLTIPSHHDILDGFADLVRLGLRYCWGLKKFTIILDVMFPDDRMMVTGATSVYANAFHILRWLPKGCKVVLQGNVSEIVRKVVVEEGRLLETLDQASYFKRQHQMPERHVEPRKG